MSINLPDLLGNQSLILLQFKDFRFSFREFAFHADIAEIVLQYLFLNSTPALNPNFSDATLMIVLVLHLAANVTLNLLFRMLILFTHH